MDRDAAHQQKHKDTTSEVFQDTSKLNVYSDNLDKQLKAAKVPKCS